MRSILRASILGGFGEQGRSCIQLCDEKHCILLDCGIRKVWHAGYFGVPPRLDLVSPEKIEAVFVSHMHEDHTVCIPILVRRGFRGPIYMTEPTKHYVEKFWRKWAKIFEEDGRKLYTEEDVDDTLSLVKTVKYGDEVREGDFVVKFVEAGHAVGAASLYVSHSKLSFAYLADMSFDSPVVVDPKLLAGYDVVVLNAAYGDKILCREVQESRFIHELGAVLRRGGVALVPTTPVGRAQELLLILRNNLSKLGVDSVRIYVDDSVRKVTEDILKFRDYLKGSFVEIVRSGDLFREPFIYFKREELDDILRNKPCIVVAPDLMLTKGTSLEAFKKICEDSKSGVLLTGYLAPGTLGELLARYGTNSLIEYGGETYRVRCSIHRVELKMHVDFFENLKVLSTVAHERSQILLHHGEEPKTVSLAYALSRYVSPDRIHVVRPGTEIVFG